MESERERHWRKLYARELERSDKLRHALQTARAELKIAASYADEPGISVGFRLHAQACAIAILTIDRALSATADEC